MWECMCAYIRGKEASYFGSWQKHDFSLYQARQTSLPELLWFKPLQTHLGISHRSSNGALIWLLWRQGQEVALVPTIAPPPKLPEPLALVLPARIHPLPEHCNACGPVGSSRSNLCLQCDSSVILSGLWHQPYQEAQTEGRKGTCPELKSIFYENIFSYNHIRFTLCLWLWLLCWHLWKGKGGRFAIIYQVLRSIPSHTLWPRNSTG